MIDKKHLEERRKEYAEELHAGSVYRDIQAREKERTIYEKRWFWELLQNAKDSVEINNKVDAKVEVSDSIVSFSHTGNPFKVDEILSLIIQGSSKIEDDNKTGRFGTGFMTTYLLSKKVEISGQLENSGVFFKFNLNRHVSDIKDTNAIKAFFHLQKDANDKFINSINEVSYVRDDRFQTRFTYILDEKGRITAEKGLKSLNALIPFTQIFNNQIDSITAIKNEESVTYTKNKISEYKLEQNRIQEWALNSSNSDDELKAYLIQDNEFDIVFITETIDGVEYLKHLSNQYPKLFFTFPLIGTEAIGIPFIVNSTQFDPKIERDGIYLKNNEKNDENINRNKYLLSQSLSVATSVFPEIIKKNKIKAHFNFFNFSKQKDHSWIDEDWFTNLKLTLIESLIEQEFISFEDVNYKYSNLKIPYSKDSNLLEKVWKLVNDSKTFSTIPFTEQNDWIVIAENFADLKNNDVFSEGNIIGCNKLMNYISSMKELNILQKDLKIDVHEWLNNLYFFVQKDLSRFPLNEKILLNQKDNFVEAEALKWDGIKDEILIKISNIIDLNFSEKLISNDIVKFEITGVENFDKESAIQEIINKLNQFSESEYALDNKVEANAIFLKWLIDNSRYDIIKDLKIVSFDKREGSNISYRVFPSGKHLLLPPKSFFNQEFPKYSEIVRDKDCMHPLYTTKLDAKDFEKLRDWGFIHYSPLVKRKEKLDSKTLELLIQNSKDLNDLRDDDGKLIEDIELEYSDFAYLTTSEGHIYDRNSTTTSSLKIFDFLLNEAALKDQFMSIGVEAVTTSGQSINFDKTLWLKRAKNIQWVNVKDIESEVPNKFVKEIPSSKNLSELIKGNDELIKTIRGEKQIAFLSKIKVGVSDLIRNTLKTEEIKISWDKALTTMITSGIKPELAQEIFSDPMIQNEYQKRLENRRLINRNQEIGALVEKCFKEFILDLQSKGVSINIKRKPFGSDYLLTEDSSDLVNDNNQEELFNINDWLIELKATGKNYAAMTSLQAERATEKKEQYALVVVPLDGSVINLEYVRNNAKVVDKIGYKLLKVMRNYNTLENQKNQLIEGLDGVSVNIEDTNVRFNIGSSIWDSENGISILDFITKYFTQ